MSNETLIAFETISKVYGEGSAMVHALAGVDLAIKRGAGKRLFIRARA